MILTIKKITKNMCGCVEYGKCEICGKEDVLERTYFIYDIPCQCCGCKEDGRNMHFELVCHCSDCVPDVPEVITPVLKSSIDNKEYRLKIEGMLPYVVRGEFCINHDLTKNHIKNSQKYQDI